MSDGRPLGSRYLLGEVLGRGVSGEVWSGADHSGRPFAFKILRAELAKDRGMVGRFLQERDALASIRHPGVVRVHDLVAEGDTLAIVMDRVDGRDLRSELRDRRTIPPETVARWGAEIAAGLQAAHDVGIVHRDVKPENILLDRAVDPPAARLTDFGVAKLLEETAEVTMTLGTPQYMAPEVSEGQTPGPAADLYGLGVTLYELACGVTPFADKTSPMAVVRAHASERPGRPPGVPDGLWQVIDHLLAKTPAGRPVSATAVADALKALAPSLVGAPAADPLTTPPAPLLSGNHLTVLAGRVDVDAPNARPAPPGRPSPAAPGYGQPGYPPPGYGQAGVPPPGYGQAGHPPPGYGQPGHPPPGYGQPGYPPPGSKLPGQGQQDPSRPPPPPRRRRSRSVAALATLVLVVAAVASGWWFGVRDRAEPAATMATPSDAPAIDQAVNPQPTSEQMEVQPWRSGRTMGPGACTNYGNGPYDLVSADTERTSCAYAEAVREAYLASGLDGRPGEITATSPTTGKTYWSWCSAGPTVRCDNGTEGIVVLASEG